MGKNQNTCSHRTKIIFHPLGKLMETILHFILCNIIHLMHEGEGKVIHPRVSYSLRVTPEKNKPIVFVTQTWQRRMTAGHDKQKDNLPTLQINNSTKLWTTNMD
jgi:hypothetical protein